MDVGKWDRVSGEWVNEDEWVENWVTGNGQVELDKWKMVARDGKVQNE